MITYRPPSSRAGGTAFDDTAIRERLDTLEANRSASPAFRPELRSRVGGLTLDSDTSALVADGGILTFRIRTPDGSEIYADAFSGQIRRFIADIAASDPDDFIEAFIDDGHIVIRPVDPTAPLHVTTAMPDTLVATFVGVDDTWFGQDVHPRPAGTYDTTSGAVRLTGPDGAYAPGSGLSVSTALEALKRLHHSRDLYVEDRDLFVIPDGIDPFTATLRQIGAALGQTAALATLTIDDIDAIGESITVTDLDETVTAFVARIPGIGGAYVETDGPGRSAIAFYMRDDSWHLPSRVRDTFGSVAIDSPVFPDRPRIRRILTRLHSDDVVVNTSFVTPCSGDHSYGFASGQLSTVLGTMLSETRSLRHRASNAELVARPEDFGADASIDADHTDAVRRAAAKAIATGCPLVLSRGRYWISQPLLVTTGLHVVIEGGATLTPRPGFVGQSLVVVGERNRVAEFWSVTGAGTIDCANAVEIGVDVVLGRFANVGIPAIRGATRHGVRIGDDAAEFSSYEVDIEALRVYRDHHANAAGSIGIYHRNATDCYVSRSYSIGYRKGFRTERGSISHSKCHAWSRPIHGPMSHAFDLAGGAGVAIDCYADTPTNYGDASISEVFGFLLSGSGTTLIAPKVFNNPSLTPDISTDGVITPFHVAPSCDAHIVTPRLLGGAANRRFRTLVSGDRSRLTLTGFNRLPLTQFVDQESSNYDDRIGNALSVSQSLTVTGGAFFLGRSQFFGPAQARSYTVAQLPAASQFTHGIVQVSNGNAGQPCLAISDGAAWRRIPLGAAVSTS